MTVSDISFLRDGKKLYAQLMLPGEGKSGPYPVVLLCHGFNGTCDHSIPYAERFVQQGFAAVIFDFIGGAMESRSGGSMMEMTVLTEMDDLLCLMDRVRNMPMIDAGRVFLFGRSQGGLVCAMAAERQPQNVQGLILLYPAFSLPELSRWIYPDPEKVPETNEFLGAVISRAYYMAVVGVDPEKLQKGYGGPVLIIQGQKDTTVPPATAETAVKNYADAVLIPLPEAGHGFSGEDFEKAAVESVRFAAEHAAIC